MPIEIWRDIPGFEGSYQVSSLGRVKSLARTIARVGGKGDMHLKEKFLKVHPNSDNYPIVGMNLNGKRFSDAVHRLVLLAFVGPRPPGMEARHLNGKRGDPRLINLEYGTPKQNASDKREHGTLACGSRSGMSKLTSEQVEEIRDLLSEGYSQSAVAAKFGVTQPAICHINTGHTWHHGA